MKKENNQTKKWKHIIKIILFYIVGKTVFQLWVKGNSFQCFLYTVHRRSLKNHIEENFVCAICIYMQKKPCPKKSANLLFIIGKIPHTRMCLSPKHMYLVMHKYDNQQAVMFAWWDFSNAEMHRTPRTGNSFCCCCSVRIFCYGRQYLRN